MRQTDAGRERATDHRLIERQQRSDQRRRRIHAQSLRNQCPRHDIMRMDRRPRRTQAKHKRRRIDRQARRRGEAARVGWQQRRAEDCPALPARQRLGLRRPLALFQSQRVEFGNREMGQHNNLCI